MNLLRHAAHHLRALLHAAALLGAASLALSASAQIPGLPPSSTATAAGPTVQTEQVRAELVAHAPQGLQVRAAMWVGLKLKHQPHWHTYWRNPGDSGLPTQLQWTLPAGVTVGDIAWPVPQRLPVGPLVNHGYEGTVLLVAPLTLNPEAAALAAREGLPLKLRADWLVCREVCIPEGGDFALTLPPQAALAREASLFERTRAQWPLDTTSAANPTGTTAPAPALSASFVDGRLRLDAQDLPAAWAGKALHVFPEKPALLDHAASQGSAWASEAGRWSAALTLSRDRSESPTEFTAVLAPDGPGADQLAPRGLRILVKPQGAWPPLPPADAPYPAASPAAPSTSPMTEGPASAGLAGLAALLGLALLGGALLNLMPCVFPVLSLKVLGFAAHASDRRALVAGGLAYTVGVVLSFVALAGLLLALRAGGEQLGWGFQLQSPLMVMALALLFTLIGLNLAGVFEFGSVLPGSWAGTRLRHPLADHFLTGVLAVAVASPCTAPFMGASVGAAFTLPTAQALSVFVALGLGMALPYLLASAWPALARALPRPGAWMAHFRTVMAFPMFATVVWLLWVLGLQIGADGLAGALGLLVAAAFAAWALGHPGLGRTARRALGGLSLLTLAACVAWAWPSLRPDEAQARPADGVASSALNGDGARNGERWQPWSAEQVARLTAEGRPVFVDYTAAWCVTCQFNKRGTLADAAVLADFERAGVVLMRADWTRRDAAIAAELARLGRNGVPVYALYRPGEATPVLLPEVLSASAIREALATLGPR